MRLCRQAPRVTTPLVCWLIAVLGLAGVSPAGGAFAQEQTHQPLTITFLVNEGFLIQADGKSVLIDAFVKDEYYGYGALTDESYRQMIAGQAPFNDVVLALTSHVHLDHFQAEPAAEFLRRNPHCVMLSGEEVVLALRNVPGGPNIGNQTVALWPAEGEIKPYEHEGIKLEAFRLRHTGTRNVEVQNLGLIFQIGEQRILHVGDADGSLDNFRPYDLANKRIDIAILPVWLFDHPTLLQQQIGAKTYIAAHIAAADLARTKTEFAEKHPGVIVLEKPMERWSADK